MAIITKPALLNIRLGLMSIIVVASLTGWWRPFMDRDWLAFAGTVIGGLPIYKEAWENLLKRRMTMELSSDRPRRRKTKKRRGFRRFFDGLLS
jgi:hypothetical protein